MANSSSLVAAGLVSFSVSAAGQPLVGLESAYRVLSISVDKGLNSINKATLALIDGDPATGKFPVCDSDTFLPGTAIAIEVGYDNVNQLLFQGIVVGVSVASQGAQGIQVTVQCQDEAVKMTGSRVVTPFNEQRTSDTLAQIVAAYPRLRADITKTASVQENQVQYNRTDWDFLVTQAEANGQVVINDNGKLTTVELATANDDALVLVYGENVYSFSLDMDARTQFQTVRASSWSSAQQKEIMVTANSPTLATLGNLTPDQLAKALSHEAYVIRTAADVAQADLQIIADAYLAKRTLAMVKGSVEMPGSHAVQPGSMVRLERIGARFSGRAFVSGVAHNISGGDWKTQLTLGMDELSFAERYPDVVPPVGATPMASGMQGLCTGVVQALQPDAATDLSSSTSRETSAPTGDFQVQVRVATLNDAVLWARLAQPLASLGTGTYFCPEVGDEVVLGFLGDSISAPVILGALHSKSRPPAYAADGTNRIKAIVTRGKLTLEFDEDNESITLKTPGNNHLVISDTANGIVLTDQQANTITLSESGIELMSQSNIHISAANNITLEARNGAVSVSGGSAVDLKSSAISASATTALVLSSDGLTTLTAGAETEVTGAIVRIN